MEIVAEAEIYEPGIGEDGKYMDRALFAHNFRNGLRCVCGTKTIFGTKAGFATHCKTAIHQAWLARLNTDRTNYYLENQRLEETVRNQRLIIARLSRKLQEDARTIDRLKERLGSPPGGGTAAADCD